MLNSCAVSGSRLSIFFARSVSCASFSFPNRSSSASSSRNLSFITGTSCLDHSTRALRARLFHIGVHALDGIRVMLRDHPPLQFHGVSQLAAGVRKILL